METKVTRPKQPKWGFSSAGRAPALHAGGQEFESPNLHHYKQRPILKSVFLFVELSIYNPFNSSKITFYKELRCELLKNLPSKKCRFKSWLKARLRKALQNQRCDSVR